MPPGGRLEVLDDVGHFVHIEQPRVVADLVLEHLGVTTVAPPAQQGRSSRCTSCAPAPAARCSTSTAWPSARPTPCPPTSPRGPGPVWGLDLSGHGASSVAVGGGYFCEVLMGDVDTAIAHLGAVTIYGRGLGAYVGLLAAGGRAEQVQGAILADGPGLAGGGPWPGSPSVATAVGAPPPGGTPDPWAHLRAHPRRPPADYAATFARQAGTRSGLDTAIAVVGVNRPPWLEGVVAEPGVVECTLDEALALFASPQRELPRR